MEAVRNVATDFTKSPDVSISIAIGILKKHASPDRIMITEVKEVVDQAESWFNVYKTTPLLTLPVLAHTRILIMTIMNVYPPTSPTNTNFCATFNGC